MSLRLGTKHLFDRLLRLLRPDLVCDVGSMDASDALRFRRHLPGARIVAFEGNPRNLSRLRRNPAVAAAGIEVVPSLVWNADGARPFFVEDVADPRDGEDIRHGISSTRPLRHGSLGRRMTMVAAVRLDTFAAGLTPPPGRIALWIDVEGAAYEVLEGTQAIAERVVAVHVEVETRELWTGQHLKPHVEALAHRLGWVTLARGAVEVQHDLLLVRRRDLVRDPGRYLRAALWAHLATNRLRGLTPQAVRELAAIYTAGRR